MFLDAIKLIIVTITRIKNRMKVLLKVPVAHKRKGIIHTHTHTHKSTHKRETRVLILRICDYLCIYVATRTFTTWLMSRTLVWKEVILVCLNGPA